MNEEPAAQSLPTAELPRETPTAQKRETRELMNAYLRYFFQHAGYKAVAASGLMVVSGLFEGSGLLILFPLLNLIGVGEGRQGNLLGSVVPSVLHGIGLPVTLPVVLGAFVLFMGGQVWFRDALQVFVSRMENSFVVALGEQLYGAMVRADWLFFTRHRGSDITHILTDEMPRIGFGTQQLLALSGLVGAAAVQVLFAFTMAPGLTLVAMSCGALLLLTLRPVQRRTQELATESHEKRMHMAAAISEHLSGMKIAKSHGREGRHLAHFQTVIREIAEHSVEFVRVYARSRARYELGAVLALAFFLYCAIRYTRLSPAELLLFVFVFNRLLPRISAIQGSWQRVIDMLPSFRAWHCLLEQFTQAQEPVWPVLPHRISLQRGIHLERVSFAYPKTFEKASLTGIDLVIPSCRTVAICGPSGAGKSTLADLILGLLRPSAGRVVIDGVPLEGAMIHHWRKSVGYVSQEPFLFNDSVRANLLWAQPAATEAEIRVALRASAAEEFVDRLPSGLDTLVGDRGVRLSGGERQRLTLARALLAQPALLVLDEATSSLDTENERVIQDAINGLHGELTVIVIAHRLSTVRNADSIVVLDKGKILEQGTWEELRADASSYFSSMAGAPSRNNPGSFGEPTRPAREL